MLSFKKKSTLMLTFFLSFFFIIVFILLNHKDWQDKIEITKFLHTINSDLQDKKNKIKDVV